MSARLWHVRRCIACGSLSATWGFPRCRCGGSEFDTLSKDLPEWEALDLLWEIAAEIAAEDAP